MGPCGSPGEAVERANRSGMADLRTEEIARHGGQAVHLNDEAARKGAQEGLRNSSHTGGPAPCAFFVFMKAFAERRMGVQYLDP